MTSSSSVAAQAGSLDFGGGTSLQYTVTLNYALGRFARLVTA